MLLDANENHLSEILELNEELVHFLSPLDMDALRKLGDMAELFQVVLLDEKVEAFLIALREGKAYESVNYKWFSEHFDRFLYVDRIVVSEKCHRLGIGRLLYDGVFQHARETGVGRVTAEIDILPENPVSLKFHAGFGFQEVGKQFVAGGKKQVSLQAVDVNG